MDRIDGTIFALPIGFIIISLINNEKNYHIRSTGSIGKQTLEIIKKDKNFKIILLSTDKNINLIKTNKNFNVKNVVVSDKKKYEILKKKLKKNKYSS